MFANLGIAVTKFVAFLLTAASSMLAESVHSLADTSNQLLLLLGGRRAKRAATTQHPFGIPLSSDADAIPKPPSKGASWSLMRSSAMSDR